MQAHTIIEPRLEPAAHVVWIRASSSVMQVVVGDLGIPHTAADADSWRLGHAPSTPANRATASSISASVVCQLVTRRMTPGVVR
jgi:hypothetical protein